MNEKKRTIGEIRCGIDFSDEIFTLKEQLQTHVAQEINMLEDIKQVAKAHPEHAGEALRWIAMAQTELENGVDKAVKAFEILGLKINEQMKVSNQ
jgi:hypothetical protein